MGKGKARAQRVVAIIPARNEQHGIAATLESIGRQTRPPDRVIVVANNCTDLTADVARDHGAEVLEMEENKHMKAGALNHALDRVVPSLRGRDCVLVMDADTTLSPNLVEECLQTLADNVRAGAVSSIFTGRESKSLLGRLQLMEYWRYKRQIHRNGNRAFVLSGTASIFRVRALDGVKRARDRGMLPFGGGGYYDVEGRTEDNEITLALLAIGFDCPVAETTSVTDVMETPGMLYKQRERWYNGAMVNLMAYGRSLPWYMRWVYWGQQAGLVGSLLFFLAYLAVLLFSPLYGGVSIDWRWLIPLGIQAIERTVTVWELGWKARLIAASLIPEQLYSVFLLLVFGIGLKNLVTGQKGLWHAT